MQDAVPPRKTASPPIPIASPPLGALLAVAGANVALAFGGWFVRLADTGPVAAGFWRIALAAPLLAALALTGGGGGAQRRPGWRLWLLIAAGGVAFAADLAAWHLGILRTTLANATLFGNCATLIFPLYGFLVARAWPTRVQGAALMLALVGGVLLMGRSYQLDPRNLAGDLLCVTAGVLYTLFFIVMARVRAAMAPIPALALSTIASAAPLLLFAALLGERIVPGDWTPLVLLALVSQVLGQGLMIYALGRLSPLVIGMGLLIQPIVAGVVGALFYGERLGVPDLVGMAMIAAALVMVSRPLRVARGRPRAHEGQQP